MSGAKWYCTCDCGGVIVTLASSLNRGKTASCGCLRRETARATGKGETRHGHTSGRPSLTWKSWKSMRDRCLLTTATGYERYGGRGIVICEAWSTFENFLADMGERPAGMTLDRIDTNGNYEPSNCRWANKKTQGRNTRTVKLEAHEPAQIRWLAESGYRRKEIAGMFGVTVATVGDIVRGDRWA